MSIFDKINVRSARSLLRGSWLYALGKPKKTVVRGMSFFYRIRMLMILSASGTFRLPRRSQAKLWVDQEVFPRIRELIARAQHTVVVQMFIWVDDALGRAMAQSLIDVADRGVKVFVSKEAVGDFFELDGDFLTTQHDQSPVWRRFWHHPNISVTHHVHHDHAKVYIIDDRIMLLTGMNITQEYHERWHDYMVELRDPSFVQRYLTRGTFPQKRRKARVVMNTERVKEIRPTVMRLLHEAKRTIVLEQVYLSDPQVLAALIAQSHAGVHVTVICSEKVDVHYYANRQAIARLLSEGSRHTMHVFVYPGWIHAKIILVDHRKAFVGSANLMASSLDEMGEVNVLIESRVSRAVQKLQDVLRRDLLKSRPLQTPPALAWFGRWLAWFRL